MLSGLSLSHIQPQLTKRFSSEEGEEEEEEEASEYRVVAFTVVASVLLNY